MYLHACLPIRVDISGTGTGHRLGRFVGLSVDVGNLGWLFLVILGYFWLFKAIFGYLWDLHLGKQCEEEGGKHPEKICGGGQENGGTLLLIQKGSLYFPFDQYIQ